MLARNLQLYRIGTALDLTAGAMPGDPYQTPPPARPYVEEVGADPGRLRIALTTARPDGGDVHPDVVAATEQAAKLLESLGHDVELAAPEWPADALRTAMTVFMAAPIAADVDARLAELGRELADDDLEPMTRMIYENGKRLTAVDAVLAHQELERAAHVLGAFHQTYDLVLSPTLGQPVPPLGLLDTRDPASMARHAPGFASFTGVANVTGQPAVSLPLATDSTGLPLGIQLMAAYGREDLLLRVSAQLEAAQPWSITPVWPAG